MSGEREASENRKPCRHGVFSLPSTIPRGGWTLAASAGGRGCFAAHPVRLGSFLCFFLDRPDPSPVPVPCPVPRSRLSSEVRERLRREMREALSATDVLLAPTTPFPPFPCGAPADPASLLLNDVLTVPASLAGVPAVSIPVAVSPASSYSFRGDVGAGGLSSPVPGEVPAGEGVGPPIGSDFSGLSSVETRAGEGGERGGGRCLLPLGVQVRRGPVSGVLAVVVEATGGWVDLEASGGICVHGRLVRRVGYQASGSGRPRTSSALLGREKEWGGARSVPRSGPRLVVCCLCRRVPG